MSNKDKNMNTEDFEEYLYNNITFDVQEAKIKIQNVLDDIYFESFLDYDQDAVGAVMDENVHLSDGERSDDVFDRISDDIIYEGLDEALNLYINERR